MLELHLDVTTPKRPLLNLYNRSFEVCPLRDIQNSVHGNNHGIPQNFVQLCVKEFHGIPQNFRQFCTEYGSYGSTKSYAISLEVISVDVQLGLICEPAFSPLYSLQKRPASGLVHMLCINHRVLRDKIFL
jgi:hypothetical protein